MSRFLLMAGGAAVTPVDPQEPVADGFPVTLDPIILALRPSGVRNLATVTAEPGDDMGALVTALATAQGIAMETPYGAEGPDHSATLFLPPGEYQGGFGTGRWLAIVGTSGNPEDVIIHSDTTAADGVVHPYSPVYFEGLTLKASWSEALDESPKYAAHIAGSPRTTFANVIFDVTEARATGGAPTSGNAGTIGMDGVPGTMVTFYACDFRDVEGNSRPGGMNIHAGPPGDIPSRVSFIDCTLPKGLGYSGPDGPVNDEVYVIGGTVGGTFDFQGGIDVFTDHPNAVNGADNVARDFTDWPIPPERGLAETWLDYYYPSSLTSTGTTNVIADVSDVAPMAPVSGRTYYCPVPIESAVHLNRWGIHVRSGAGASWGWIAQPDPGVYYGSPVPGNEPEASSFPASSILPAGRMLATYYYSWVLYPAATVGGNRGWFHFRIPDASGVTIDGSAEFPSLHDCYYSDDDGVTLVKAAPGTPFPLAHAAQVR